jgi:hypothetical protein
VHVLPISVQDDLEPRLLRQIAAVGVKGLVALEENDAVATAVQRAGKPAPQGGVPIAPRRRNRKPKD